MPKISNFKRGAWALKMQLGVNHNAASCPISVVARLTRSCGSLREPVQMGTIVAIDRETDPNWDGYRITTTEQEICLFISNGQSCCEDFGISLTLPAGVRQNGVGLRVQRVRWGKDFEDRRTETHGATLEIATSQGLIIISAWNTHNGYYAHDLMASWKGFQDEQIL